VLAEVQAIRGYFKDFKAASAHRQLQSSIK